MIPSIYIQYWLVYCGIKTIAYVTTKASVHSHAHVIAFILLVIRATDE